MSEGARAPAAHGKAWQIGEVVFGLPLLAAMVLHWLLPLRVHLGAWGLAAKGLGAALIVVAIAFVVSARRELARYRQPTDPGHPTTRLVTTGIFALSRNPLYLAAACLVVGIALLFGLVWLLLLFVPTLIACHLILIVPEERYLAARFGAEYDAYRHRVGRWLGRR